MDFPDPKQFLYWDVKSLMILVLGILFIVSFYWNPAAASVQMKAAHVLVAAVTCVVLSLLIRLFIKKKEFKISKDAAITGMIIAAILAPTNLWLTAAVSATAIILKNVLRFEARPLFNPAALALVVCAMMFNAPLSWWALGPAGLLGLWFVYRMGKIPLVISFLVTIAGLFLLWELGQDTVVLSRFLPGLAPAAFLAFFMLTEPKTTPLMRRSQMAFGAGTAILGFLHSVFLPVADPLLVGLLLMNAFRPMLEKIVR